MATESIPDDVKRFILLSIESVPHLETLLLFHRNPDMEWEAKDVAQRLFISEKITAKLLEKLHSAGFLAVKTGPVPLYRYSPNSESQGQMVARLAKAHSEQLIAVTDLIYSKADTKVKQFADSFKLKVQKAKGVLQKP